LTTLHTTRYAGATIDEARLEQAVEAATRAIIARQIEAGIDIVNNGELGRESFFTYIQHRMSGFGGVNARPIMADLTRYPGSLERHRQAMGAEERGDLLKAPKAVAAVNYVNAAPIEQECRQLKRLLNETGAGFSEAFISSPSPSIIAAAMQNDYYQNLEAYVNAVAEALRTEYAAIAAAGFLLQIDAPDLALERHTWRISGRRSRRSTPARLCFPWPIPATRMSTACLKSPLSWATGC
jgi:5-methyltetrahydropteroyltriglutamate--homocysteine methyltransferase